MVMEFPPSTSFRPRKALVHALPLPFPLLLLSFTTKLLLLLAIGVVAELPTTLAMVAIATSLSNQPYPSFLPLSNSTNLLPLLSSPLPSTTKPNQTKPRQYQNQTKTLHCTLPNLQQPPKPHLLPLLLLMVLGQEAHTITHKGTKTSLTQLSSPSTNHAMPAPKRLGRPAPLLVVLLYVCRGRNT